MSDIVTPRVDLAFKKIFGTEENKDVLLSLVNSIVSEEDQVESITLLNPYTIKDFKQDKGSILDIKAQGKDGAKLNIEMQVQNDECYDKRALYYWSRLYASQIGSSEEYERLKKTIGIHILNFSCIPQKIKYANTFVLTEVDTGVRYFHDIELHTVELGKYESSSSDLNKFVDKIHNLRDAWVTFFSKPDDLDSNNLPDKLNHPEIKKALKTLETMNFTKEERESYDARLKWLRDEASILSTKFNTGKAEGIKEGIEKGIEKGIEEVTRNLLSMDLDITAISKATGLSESEIKKIKDS